MSCPIPWPKKMPNGSIVFVPCGKCIACRIDKRNEWTWRLMSEIQVCDSVFLTLTIDDDNLQGPSLKKRSVQLFLKRFRKALDGRKIKYFFVGEYGEIGMRPHYHAIICNVSTGKPMSYDTGDVDILRSCWPYGFIKVVPASKGSIRYVLKYMDKMQDDDVFNALHPNLVPPFRLMSKGIGRGFIEKYFSSLRDNDGNFFFDGVWRPLPRYYKEKLFTHEELENKARVMSKSQHDKILEYMERYDVNQSVARFELGKQKLVNLKAKQNVDGKDIT